MLRRKALIGLIGALLAGSGAGYAVVASMSPTPAAAQSADGSDATDLGPAFDESIDLGPAFDQSVEQDFLASDQSGDGTDLGPAFDESVDLGPAFDQSVEQDFVTSDQG